MARPVPVNISPICFRLLCYLSSTPRTHGKSSDGQWLTGPRESHPSEDLSELPPLRDPAVKQGCGWTGVPLYPLPVMAAPGAARFLQTAVSRSYKRDDRKTRYINRWDLLIHTCTSWRGL